MAEDISPIIAELDAAVQEGDKRRYFLAVRGLLAIRSPAAAPAVPALTKALAEALKDQNWILCSYIARVIRAIGSPAAPAAPVLTKLLAARSDNIRRYTTGALVAIGQAALPALERAMKDDDSRVHDLATEIYGRIACGDGATDVTTK